MALSGTIHDFGLADIFQLIGIQRKTGLLTLEADGDAVTVKFFEGQVVGADTRSASVEDLLGAVLVRTGRISAEQLNGALVLQKKTLQRLGYILVKNGLISEDELVEALRVQSLQIVYRLFRWRSGSYSFATADGIDYDQKHFVPISAETILMEGARMIDEWPIIERRIRSDEMVVRLTDLAAGLDRDPDAAPLAAEMNFDFVFDRRASDEPPEPPAEDGKPKIEISFEERQVLRLVDGSRTVQQINDHANMGEFDTYRILADLVTRKLVEEVKRPTVADVRGSGRKFPEKLLHLMIGFAMTLFIAATLSSLPDNAWTPWHLGLKDDATGTLQHLASRQRMERIEAALEVFYLDRTTFPQELTELTAGNYLGPTDLLDPWGRPYEYVRSEGGFRILGGGADGRKDEDLVVRHRFTSVQRMMLAPQPSPTP